MVVTRSQMEADREVNIGERAEGIGEQQGETRQPRPEQVRRPAPDEGPGVQHQIQVLAAQMRDLTQILAGMQQAGAAGSVRQPHTQINTNPKTAGETQGEEQEESKAEGSSTSASGAFVHGSLPWTQRIMDSPMPRKIHLPKLDKYDGTTDPEEHLIHYQNCMALQNEATEALMCRAFVASLKGSALAWLHKLPPKSVDSFDDLALRFVSRFIASKSMRRTSAYLLQIRQQRGESLRQYISRFSTEMTSVDGCTDEFVVTALTRGLLPGRLADSLLKKPPATASDMLDKAQKYIKLEEFRAAGAEESSARPDAGKRSRTYDDRPSKARTESRLQNIQFTKAIDKVFREVKGTMDFKNPTPMRAPVDSRDKSRYCEYHRDIGHRTDECRNLSFELERLAKEGKLDDFLPRTDRQHKIARIDQRSEDRDRTSDRHRERHNRDQEGTKGNTIFVIHAATERSGTSNTARKRKLHELYALASVESPPSAGSDSVITFSKRDCHALHYPHDDPLVITLKIGGFDVRRVLVDGGSAINAIYTHAFDKMNIGREQLTKTASVITGFAGETSTPLGTVRLPVHVGSGDTGKTVLSDFFIIQSPSPYNAIVGRAWMHDLQAVASPYHQCLKYEVNGQTGTVIGDHIMARECEAAAMKASSKKK